MKNVSYQGLKNRAAKSEVGARSGQSELRPHLGRLTIFVIFPEADVALQVKCNHQMGYLSEIQTS